MDAAFSLIVILIFTFTYVNGFHDGCNVVATLISSRAMRPKPALAWAAVVEFLSPFMILIIGAGVSNTIQKLVDQTRYTDPAFRQQALIFIAAGMLAALVWNLTTWKFGIPASSSHSLIGGVVGAGIAAFGTISIAWDYFLFKIVVMIFLTPVLSFILGFLLLKLIMLLLKRATVKVNYFFKYAQYVNVTFLAFNHSFNDSQKSLGIIMILMGIYFGPDTKMPVWAILIAACCLASGILFGGFRIIKTVGTGIYKVKMMHSFTSQLASSTIILAASLLGAPVSASQIVSSSIMGVGTAERIRNVKWKVAGKILASWFITIPIASTAGAVIYLFLSLFL